MNHGRSTRYQPEKSAIMCIALPARITRITVGTGFPMATVDVGGTTRDCCMIYIPEATVGDYIIIHAGFALRIIDEPEALATLALFAQFAPSPLPTDAGASNEP